MASSLGKTLLIANPAAQNGKGISLALFAREYMKKILGEDSFSLQVTKGALHGRDLASKAIGCDTVVALGGDGLIHEVANGLMMLPEAIRPSLGVLPAGSGNDYARTLGISFEIERSLEQLFKSEKHMLDLGICNERYFVETISFGLDAAIALDTMNRRKKTGKTGTRLFLESGIDVLLHQRNSYKYEVSFDDGEPLQGEMLIFANQIGPSYGGGFSICPEAKYDDGILDICIAHPPMGALRALFIFLLAKNAHHTKFEQLDFYKAKKINIQFLGEQPPAQVDGENIKANSYEISCVPSALSVLVP